MKTKIITGLKKEVLVIELPEYTKSWKFIDGHFWIDDKKTFIKGFSPFHKLLGKADEIREDDAKGIVGELYCDNHWCEDGKIHQDYGVYVNCEVCEDIHVKELLSAIEREIYWENPIPKPVIQGVYDDYGIFHGGWDDSWISAFDEAQEKTFDRNRTLIFVKD